ncbi:hypothetical protein CFOL_v3_10057 [Cephalotus follicularis]|uniref:Zf-RVT domain-containing protein n=1 Tax=Cephalotus follicularis TaxID=3775 RepID=A0A1Q3BEU1_CEPFO|nr:hypothetical protein CFOL_v3_10057 [Cephalotus follicularis]
MKSLEHLYFQCPKKKYIWKAVLAKCNICRPIFPWMEEVQWMIEHKKGNKFSEMVRKLALAATIYHIWLERNRRCFNNLFLHAQEIIRKITQEVAWKIYTVGNILRSERHHNLCVN